METKGKMTEERLRELAYSVALSAATAKGKGVVGLGRRSDGKQCLHFLAPMRSPKDQQKFQFFPVINNNSISISTNCTPPPPPQTEYQGATDNTSVYHG